MCVEIMRLIAVGMPMGQSFFSSVGSLWRQKRYVSVKKWQAASGIFPKLIVLKSCCRFVLMTLSFNLTRSMNASIESVNIPVPLFLLDFELYCRCPLGG
jgi:hypothetical protein